MCWTGCCSMTGAASSARLGGLDPRADRALVREFLSRGADQAEVQKPVQGPVDHAPLHMPDLAQITSGPTARLTALPWVDPSQYPLRTTTQTPSTTVTLGRNHRPAAYCLAERGEPLPFVPLRHLLRVHSVKGRTEHQPGPEVTWC